LVALNDTLAGWFAANRRVAVKTFTAPSAEPAHLPVDATAPFRNPSRQGETAMITACLFLATVTGLGFRLARWVADLPDNPGEARRPTAVQPRQHA
jgi:hypothetical protein